MTHKYLYRLCKLKTSYPYYRLEVSKDGGRTWKWDVSTVADERDLVQMKASLERHRWWAQADWDREHAEWEALDL